MCGRYTDTKRDKKFLTRLGVSPEPVELDFTPRYNIAPTQDAWIIVAGERDGPEMKLGRWGLVPSWAQDEKIGSSLINARSETVATKPAFRRAFRKRRCLVLGDGFYEWQKIRGGKQPMFIRLKEGKAFAFGGLWETWATPNQELTTFSILTVTPNEVVAKIHDRMPFILPEAAIPAWLDPSTSPDQIQSMLNPFASNEMESYPVSSLVNSSARDDVKCMERFTDPFPVLEQREFTLF